MDSESHKSSEWTLCGVSTTSSSPSSWDLLSTGYSCGPGPDCSSLASVDCTSAWIVNDPVNENEEEFFTAKSKNRKFLRAKVRQSESEKPYACHDLLHVRRPDQSDETDYDEFLCGSRGSVTVGLNKKQRWRLLPILEEDATSVQRKPATKQGEMEVFYDVPVIGSTKSHETACDKSIKEHLASDPYFSTSDKRKSHMHVDMYSRLHIYIRQFDRWVFDGYFTPHVPEELEEMKFIEEYKQARFYASRGARRDCDPNKARCRKHASSCFFAPKCATKGDKTKVQQYLEVDLRTPRPVTHITVSGRFPKTKLKRRFEHEGRSGVYLQSLCKEDQGREWFFTAYKVYYRIAPGQPWVFLDQFLGPSHNYEEKVQALNLEGRSCRYIRIVPIIEEDDLYPEARGLRVSVFGWDKEHEPSASATQSQGKTIRASDRHNGRATEEDDLTFVTVSFTTAQGPRWCPKGRRGCYCEYCRTIPEPRCTRKKKLRKDVYEQIESLPARLRKTVDR